MASGREEPRRADGEREQCDSGKVSSRREAERNAGPAGPGRPEERGLPTLSPRKPNESQAGSWLLSGISFRGSLIPPERKIPKHQMLRAVVHIPGSLSPAASWVPGAKRWARTARPLSPNPQQDRPPHPPDSWGSSGGAALALTMASQGGRGGSPSVLPVASFPCPAQDSQGANVQAPCQEPARKSHVGKAREPRGSASPPRGVAVDEQGRPEAGVVTGRPPLDPICTFERKPPELLHPPLSHEVRVRL